MHRTSDGTCSWGVVVGAMVIGASMVAAGVATAAEPRESYLGIIVGPLSDEVRAQLDLPARGGLTIRSVAPDGPARKAGIEPHDILMKFGEHEVSSPLELAEKVADSGVGKRVVLTLIRGGRQREIPVVLTAREPGKADINAPAEAPRALPGMGQVQIQNQLRAFAGGGNGPAQQSSSVQMSTTSINGRTQSTLVSTDAEGTVEIQDIDGAKTVTIRGADGREVHRGPLANDADREKVPKAFREKVRKLEAQMSGGAKPDVTLPRGAI